MNQRLYYAYETIGLDIFALYAFNLKADRDSFIQAATPGARGITGRPQGPHAARRRLSAYAQGLNWLQIRS